MISSLNVRQPESALTSVNFETQPEPAQLGRLSHF
jgi:hypothetical protein